MTVSYPVTVTITARTQEELFEFFGDLVDICIDLSNAHSTATVDIDELDPNKMSYSDE